MAVVGELLVLIGGTSAPLTAALAKSEAELKGFSASATSHYGQIGMVGAAVAVGAAVIGAEALKSAATFQSSMTLIRTQAGGTQAEVEAMTAGIMALAPAVGFGPDALAQGLYHVESAGIRGAKALDVLKIAAEGSKVGHASLESTTNALIAAVNSGVPGVKDMGGAMGTLNAIVGAGNMRMEDLTGAMSTGVLSAGTTFGVSLQSIGGALATMTAQGIPAEEAATRLRMTLSLIGAPSAKAVRELGGIGLSATQLAKDMRHGGILEAATDLKKHLEGAGLTATEQAAVISRAFGGGRSSSAIMALLNAIPQFQTIQTQIDVGQGGFDDAWLATQKEAVFQFDRVKASIETVMDALGAGLLPILNQALDTIVPLVSGFAKWATDNQGTAATILMVAAAIGAVAAAGLLLGPLLTVVGFLANPIVLLAAAAGALAAHFGLLGEGAQGFVDGVLTQIAAMIPGVVSTLQGLAAQVVAWIADQAPIWLAQLQAWGQAFVAWVGPMIPPAIAALGALASQVASWIGAQVPGWLDQLGTWAQAFVDWVGPMIPPALDELGKLAGKLLGWIGDQIPVLTKKAQELAAAFIDWIKPIAEKVPGAFGDVATKLITWLGDQVQPVLKAAAPVGKAILDGAVGALVGIGGLIIGKIADSIKTFDVTKVGDNLKNVMQGVTIIAAVGLAGTAVGAAFAAANALAAAVVDKLTGLFKAAMVIERNVLVEVVKLAGSLVGAAFGLAFRVAAAVVEGLTTLFGTAMIPVQTALAAQMTASGTIVGAAFALAVSLAILGALALAADEVQKATGGGVYRKEKLPGDQLAWPLGPKGTPDVSIGPFQHVLGGDSVPRPPTSGIPGLAGGLAAGGPAFANQTYMVGERGPELLRMGSTGGRITPNAGGPVHLTHTTVIQLDGQTIGRLVETLLFDHASGASSGFAGSPVSS